MALTVFSSQDFLRNSPRLPGIPAIRNSPNKRIIPADARSRAYKKKGAC